MQTTPRLFFSLKTARREAGEYLPLKFAWFKKEKGSLTATISLVLLIELWQNIRMQRLAAYADELAAAIITMLLFICLAFYLQRRAYALKREVTIKG